ncbi:hypothetical protein L1887_20837 [Cichorium endivia]|nr:hypothetical protein L1887_20837 [Cichorium endivia]
MASSSVSPYTASVMNHLIWVTLQASRSTWVEVDYGVNGFWDWKWLYLSVIVNLFGRAFTQLLIQFVRVPSQSSVGIASTGAFAPGVFPGVLMSRI